MGGLMRGFLFAIWAWCAAMAVANAGGYGHFVQGMSAMNAGKSELAIEAFTKALDAGDLAPVYVPITHFRRANLYLNIGKCREALADLDAAVALKPADVGILAGRAQAHLCLKDDAAAERDLLAAIASGPNESIYRFYARYKWVKGDFAAAAENFAQAHKMMQANKKRPIYDKHQIYAALWYAISAARAGGFDAAAFKAMAESFDGEDWPRPVADYYLGKLDPDGLVRKAAAAEAKKNAHQSCEADFYIGEWLLAHGDKALAETKIAAAVARCPHNFVEYDMGVAELERLREKQKPD